MSIGKWIAPAGGIRLQGFYGSNAGRASNDKPYYWDAMGVGLDGLFNFTNLFCGYEEDRTFNLIGILGAITNTPPTSASVPGTTEYTIPNRKTCCPSAWV
ncbi:hypothetical protein NXX77_01065 [Phocaeicola dorei]|nr:hypothetical protein [Phocaeicola dorei]